MPLNLHTVLWIVALVCFILAAAGVGAGRINLIALGLAIWVLALLLSGERLSP